MLGKKIPAATEILDCVGFKEYYVLLRIVFVG